MVTDFQKIFTSGLCSKRNKLIIKDTTTPQTRCYSTLWNASHMLDLVITRSDTSISALRVGDMVSAHALIRFNLHVMREHSDTQWIMHRVWRRLSSDAFTSDLAASALCSDLMVLEDNLLTIWLRCMAASWYGYWISTAWSWRSVTRPSSWHRERRLSVCTSSWEALQADPRWGRQSRLEQCAQIDALAVWEEKQQLLAWQNCCEQRQHNAPCTFRGVLGEAPRPHSAEDFASFFRDKVDGVRASSSSTSTYDVPLKSHTDFGRMDACVSQWGWKTEWHSHEQNVRPWSSPYVAGEGNAGTFIPIHNDIVQQVADHRLFSCGIQAGSCPAAVTEAWTWCQRPEEFLTCVQPAIPLQIVGKSHTVVYTGSRRSLTSTGWCWWHSLLARSITAWRWPQPKSSMTCCLLQTGGRWRHSACST